MSHISIYLTNLGKYNEGELVGEWVELPVSDEELQEVYKRIGISDEPNEDGTYYEETFITDYESDIPGLHIDEYDSISNLNEIAESVENLDDYDLKIFKNAVEAGYIDADDIADFDPDDFYLYEDVSDDGELGEIIIDELYGSPSGLDSETLERYFDYDAYGRDIDLEWDPWSWIDDEEEAKEQFGVDDIGEISAFDYFGVSSDYELAEHIIDDIYGNLSELGKDTLEMYFDYDSYGRDCAFDGCYTEDGWLWDRR